MITNETIEYLKKIIAERKQAVNEAEAAYKKAEANRLALEEAGIGGDEYDEAHMEAMGANLALDNARYALMDIQEELIIAENNLRYQEEDDEE